MNYIITPAQEITTTYKDYIFIKDINKIGSVRGDGVWNGPAKRIFIRISGRGPQDEKHSLYIDGIQLIKISSSMYNNK